MLECVTENIRKAAHGKHVCQLCLTRIAAGERYRDARMAEDGTMWTWREHLDCSEFMLLHECDEWDAIGYANLMREHEAGLCCEPTIGGTP